MSSFISFEKKKKKYKNLSSAGGWLQTYYKSDKISSSLFFAAVGISTLRLSTLGKIFRRRHIEIVFLFFPENRIWYFIQTVSSGNNLYEMCQILFSEKN